ncbi:TIGR04211 family SH3 domain-containing protein [Kushneria indalinina]|uniref:SH3 domain protein n=1 Tax=Kushneria indalinina DSM 14324 TaxID=1122140 RepID=A0A3D9E0R4_9GAMM|nr:TIGR04211 family SH3 domain-containing protein [Kushneria indalinina]REC96633.1 SH3 domain protein [Kushneria indalinina DSM 14324]
MKTIGKLCVGILIGVGISTAHAEEARWVSDSLSTYVRSGPTDSYRIVGTVDAGQRVTQLETQGDYSRIQTEGGDTVWIPSDDLQAEQSVQDRMPEMQERVQTLTQRLEGIDDEWNDRVADMKSSLQSSQARVNELQTSNDDLNAQLTQAQSKMREYQAKLDTEREDLLMRYFVYGGSVAGGGLVLGLLVPHLPRRRKKRDRWF